MNALLFEVAKVLARIGSAAIVVTLLAAASLAQSGRAPLPQGPPPQDDAPPPQGPPQTPAPMNPEQNLIRFLNLSPEQIEKVRGIYRESNPRLRVLRQNLLASQRALDDAIYSETADEAVIEQRVREFALAQAAITRLRALTELSIRRILTPEQLVQLKIIRDRAQQEAQRQMMPPGPGMRDGRGPMGPSRDVGMPGGRTNALPPNKRPVNQQRPRP